MRSGRPDRGCQRPPQSIDFDAKVAEPTFEIVAGVGTQNALALGSQEVILKHLNLRPGIRRRMLSRDVICSVAPDVPHRAGKSGDVTRNRADQAGLEVGWKRAREPEAIGPKRGGSPKGPEVVIGPWRTTFYYHHELLRTDCVRNQSQDVRCVPA